MSLSVSRISPVRMPVPTPPPVLRTSQADGPASLVAARQKTNEVVQVQAVILRANLEVSAATAAVSAAAVNLSEKLSALRSYAEY